MKRTLVICALVCTFVLLTGCPASIEGARLREINDEWFRIYSMDRRMTADEATLYAALPAAEQEKWAADGKPVPAPLSPRTKAAAEDYHKAVGMEAAAAEE